MTNGGNAGRRAMISRVHVTASVVTTLGQLGVAATIAALVTAVLTARATRKRERDNARRAWLGEALANFYGPVATRLELTYQWDHDLCAEIERRRGAHAASGEPPAMFPTTEDKLLWKLVGANVRMRREVTRIIEDNLHYVDSADLQDAAVAYLSGSHISDWKRQVLERPDEPTRGIVMLGDHEEPRSEFHVLVKAAFDAKGREFRKLSQD